MNLTLRACCVAAGLVARAMCAQDASFIARPPLLMPAPSDARFAGTATAILTDVTVTLPANADPVLRSAADRLTRRLRDVRGPSSRALPAATPLDVRVTCPCAPGSGLSLRADEGSTITIAGNAVEVRAETEVGVLRAFATLTQLAQAAPSGFTLPIGSISDRPRFAWRGLMIDVARHFQSVAALKRQIDAMELVKLNVLHLHLSDNEAWRIESVRYPRLHTVASGGEYYTQAQLRELVAYAAARGVRVVPEIDLPGHSRALAMAYPVVASDTLLPRTSVIDPTRESTYTFLTNLLTEVTALFPDPYFHAGADEVNDAQWTRNPAIVRYMRQHGLASARALQAAFTTRLHGIVQRLGKTMIGWDEMLAPDLPPNIVVQSWRSSSWTTRAAQQGHDVIVSAGMYLDWLTPSDGLHRMDPFDMRAFGLSAADRVALRGTRLETSIPEGFVTDTLLQLAASDERHVLGGEAAMWTELVTEEKLDAAIWPRTAAIADLLWSPRASAAPPVVDRLESVPRTFDERMRAVSNVLERVGVQHRTGPLAMRRRLAPANGDALEVLATALEPVKYYAHNHKARGQSTPPQSFAELADALSPESEVATRFNRLARTWVPFDRSNGDELRATLARWRDQARGMDSLIARYPALADARDASHELSLLATGALEAMDMMELGTRGNADWRGRYEPTLDKHRGYADATKNFVVSFLAPQPPGDVVIAPLAGLRQLILSAAPR